MPVDKTWIDWTHGHPLAVCFAERKKKGRRGKNHPPPYSTRTRSVSRITTFWAGIRCKRPFNHQTECTIRMRIVYLLNLPPPPPLPPPPLPTLLSKDSSGIRPRPVVITTITPPIQPRMLLNFCPSNPRSLGKGNVLQEDD